MGKLNHKKLLICCLVMLLVACGKELTDVEYVERAKDFQDQGDLVSAIIELKNAANKNPENPEARWLLGSIYVELGDGASAEKELRRAADLGVVKDNILLPLSKALFLQRKYQTLLDETSIPVGLSKSEKVGLQVQRGKAYLALGNRAEAAKAMNLALQEGESVLAAWLGQAWLEASLQNWDKVHDWLDQVLEADSSKSEAWSLKGDVERLAGNLEKANEAYSKAIEHRLNHWEDRLKRANVRILLKNYTDAERDVRAIKKAFPNHGEAFYAQGLIYYHQKLYSKAQTEFEHTLRYRPRHSLAMFYSGAVHFAQDNLQQAENYLQKFLSRHPSSFDGMKLLAAVHLHKGDAVMAESLLKPIINSSQGDADILRLLGNAYLAQGKTQEGVDLLEDALAIQHDALLHAQLGLGLMMEGEVEEGIKAFKEASEIDPQFQQLEALAVQRLLEMGRYDAAIMEAQRLRDLQPDSPIPLTLIGVAQFLKREVPEARSSLQQVLENFPGSPYAAIMLARLELTDGKPNQAIEFYGQVLENRPGHLIALLEFADLKMQQGALTESNDLLKQAIDHNPQALEPRLRLASYYLRSKKPTKAIALIRPVEQLYPNNPHMLVTLGEAHIATGANALALRSFQNLVETQPSSAQGHYLLAKAHGALKNQESMRIALEKTLVLNSQHGLAKIALARLLMEDKQPTAANKLLYELKQSFPQDLEVAGLEGWLALQQGRPEEAVKVYQSVLKKVSNSTFTVNLAHAQWQAGDTEGSVNTLEGWLKKQPDDISAQYALGEAYLALNRNNQAKALFAKIVEHSPNSPQALNNLAWLLRSDDPDKALELAERALELVPGSGAVLDTLGMILLERGQTKRAVTVLKVASNKVPSNLEMRYHLALAFERNGNQQEAREVLDGFPVQHTTPQLKENVLALLERLVPVMEHKKR